MPGVGLPLLPTRPGNHTTPPLLLNGSRSMLLGICITLSLQGVSQSVICYSSEVVCLPTMQKALGSVPSTTEKLVFSLSVFSYTKQNKMGQP